MSWKSGSLNLLEPSGPHWTCYGTPVMATWVATESFISFFMCSFSFQTELLISALNCRHMRLQSEVEGQCFWHCNIYCSITDGGNSWMGLFTLQTASHKLIWALSGQPYLVNSNSYPNCVKHHQIWPCNRFWLHYDKTKRGKVSRYLFLHYTVRTEEQ